MPSTTSFSLDNMEVCRTVCMTPAECARYVMRAYYARLSAFNPFRLKAGGYLSVEFLPTEVAEFGKIVSRVAKRPYFHNFVFTGSTDSAVVPPRAEFYMEEDDADRFECEHERHEIAKKCDAEKFVSYFKKQCGQPTQPATQRSKKQRIA